MTTNNDNLMKNDNMMTICAAYAGEDEVVVGSNPEMAEPGNPDGYSYARLPQVMAETAAGRRFVLQHSFEADDAALAARVAAKAAARGAIDLRYWGETFEVYGSPAWQAEDQQREFAHQMNPATRGTVRDF